jgi:L-threonylcarbamoyladenylate synthase
VSIQEVCDDEAMTRVTVSGRTPEPGQLTPAIDAIRAHRVVAYPTDTFYGLAVDPRSPDAVARLFALKGRAADNAVPLVAANLDQVAEIGMLTPVARRLAGLYWPGPLTLVLPVRPGLAPALLGKGGTVAVRVPAHPLARALAELAAHALTATSANPSGQPPTAEPDEVARMLPGLDLLLDGGAAPGGSPSTIVDLSASAPRLIRAGAVPWERVLESLGISPTTRLR